MQINIFFFNVQLHLSKSTNLRLSSKRMQQKNVKFLYHSGEVLAFIHNFFK